MGSAQVTQAPMSGLNTLWAFGKERGGPEQARAVGLVGFFGQDQPSQWLVLVSDARVPSTYREYVVRQGRTVNMRTFQRQSGQDMPSIPLPLNRLKIDSQQAFRICEATAIKAGIGFDSLHYQLRCRDLRNEPVWVVNLLDRSRATTGVIYLSAVDGNVLRTVWNQPGNSGQYSQAPRVPNAPQSQEKGLLGKIVGKIKKPQSQQPAAISSNAAPRPAPTPRPVPGPRQVPGPPSFSN